MSNSTGSTDSDMDMEELLNVSSKLMNDVRQDIQFMADSEIHSETPLSFLSESVQKYLELGRSIPGMYWISHNY